ncbi:hypothetical protein B0T25DRAFT_614708 [Lasiosphaeria hispida]|uniref:Uncharacterized protein n=1 Tax=Lasiosphaeria hispida TaxID=260671 RepID=A0AAJ0H8P7_9PEZI|nr:hypothetical protein B0T25DRAFT_614708 [Lasiosphaeria hispida]
MDHLHQHFGSRSVWEKYDVSNALTINVTEIWGNDEAPTSVVESKAISSTIIDNWLDEAPSKYILAHPHTRLLRLIWVGLDPATYRASPSTRDLQRLLATWDLQDGYDYALSCFAGVSALPTRGDTRVFTVTYHPKLAMSWSHTVSDGVPCTQVVVFAEGEERTELLGALKSKWAPSLVSHPMFPAFLCSLMLSQEMDTTLDDIKGTVREVEARTGHHRFTTRRQTRPAAGELGNLSAQMSGCAAKLANGTRKLQVIESLNSFMLHHASVQDTPILRKPRSAFEKDQGSFLYPRIHTKPIPNPSADDNDEHDDNRPSSTTLVTSYHALVAHRTQMQTVDSAYVQQRVQVQIAALFHLIAQQDNAIAFETASATRSIAKDSLRDSSSMKMLALVAMFFLPGSFVAALFSTPLFVWDGEEPGTGIGVATRPQFKLFWAVAVPLTVLTFVLYGVWIVAQKRRERRRLRVGDV